MPKRELAMPDVHLRFDGLRAKERNTLLRHGFRSPAEVAAASDAELLAVHLPPGSAEPSPLRGLPLGVLGPRGVLRVRAWLRAREGD